MDSKFGSFKRGLKKMASRARLPSGRRGSQESQRNVTPPRSTIPEDTFTTPPTLTATAGLDDTPEDLAIATPGTPIIDDFIPSGRSIFSFPKKKDVQPAIRVSVPAENELDAELLQAGITGVDFDLPLFDGQSNNPDDHIIDLDTDSMERCADVRVYFWSVGDQLQCERQWELDEPDIERPDDPELCLEYDDKLVKMGRLYLKESRLKKEGYYISRDRDSLDEFLKGNHPGAPWYRLPTVGLVKHLGEVANRPDFVYDESLFDCSGKRALFDVVKTNIRVPMIWIEALKKGVVQGTQGWDIPIMSAYASYVHPVFRILSGDETNSGVVAHVILCPGSPPNSQPCDSIVTRHVLARDFAHFDEPVKETMDPQKKAELRAELMSKMSSWDNFIYGKPEFRKK